MELQSRDAPLPPFFAAVRRRHPDVDIVLLAPEPVDDDHPEPVTEGQLANAFDLTTGTATKAWAEAVGDGQVPETRYAFGSDETTVIARARVATRSDGSVLEPLAAALAQDGWDVARRPGDVSRLAARRATMQLLASYVAANGAFVLTVTSAPMPVGLDRARELVRRDG